jgi:hypothetical protein
MGTTIVPDAEKRGPVVRRRQYIVASLLGASLGLSACGGPLVGIGEEGQRPGIPTATIGISDSPTSPPLFESPAPSPDLVESPPAEAAPPAEGEAPPAEGEGAVEPPPAEGAEPPPAVEPTVNPEFAGVTLPSVEERWRYVQVDRQPFESIQTWNTPSRQILWWYDPVYGRTIKLGEIQGDFPAQATFRFRGQEVEAVEIPYNVNQSFGITVPPAIVEQIRSAGYGEWIETFMYRTEDIRPR